MGKQSQKESQQEMTQDEKIHLVNMLDMIFTSVTRYSDGTEYERMKPKWKKFDSEKKKFLESGQMKVIRIKDDSSNI